MKFADILELLDEQSDHDHVGLAIQLSDRFPHQEEAVTGMLPTPERKVTAYTNENAILLANAVRAVLEYGVDEYPDDLIERIRKAFRVQLIGVDCEYVDGGTLISPMGNIIFLGRHIDDPLFQFSHEVGRILLSLSNAHKSAATLTLSEWESTPRRHHFARRFAMELLVTNEVLARSLARVRDGLSIDSPTIGDIEILSLSRLFGINFFHTAFRLEMAELLPAGGAASMVYFIDEKHGSVDERARELGFPPRVKLEP